MDQLLYTIDETAEILRSSRTSVYRLIKSGLLVSVKVSGSRRVTGQAIERFIASLEKQSQHQSIGWDPR
jgi:excisionase family DNA binding protein